jgi:hypothetical protein
MLKMMLHSEDLDPDCAPTTIADGKSIDFYRILQKQNPRGFVVDSLPFIETGGAMGRRPNQGNEKRLGPVSTLSGTIALSFVIPRRRPAWGKLREE